jgi:hypothetical protein
VLRLRRLAPLALLACNPPAAGEPVQARPPDPSPAAVRCDEPPAGALALLSDPTCPWALVAEGGALALRSLAPGGRALAVAPPDGCKPCRFEGVLTAAGPLLLATRPAADSELADAAWIGATSDGAAVLAFAPLWYGQADLGDRTAQGPTYALAPRVCDRSLVLSPAPRLPGARGEEPPAALARAAGVYAIRGGELVLQDVPVPSDISTCDSVPLELP